MHELGIVMNVLETAKKAAEENDLKKVTRLRLEVGEVSSIVPQLFIDAFDWAKKRNPGFEDCEMEMIVIQGISYCTRCKRTYETTKYAKICPYCKSPETYLVTGNEISIKDMEGI